MGEKATVQIPAAEMENVFYFHQPNEVVEGFFADGLHPSEKGYDVWSEAMLNFSKTSLNPIPCASANSVDIP